MFLYCWDKADKAVDATGVSQWMNKTNFATHSIKQLLRKCNEMWAKAAMCLKAFVTGCNQRQLIALIKRKRCSRWGGENCRNKQDGIHIRSFTKLTQIIFNHAILCCKQDICVLMEKIRKVFTSLIKDKSRSEVFSLTYIELAEPSFFPCVSYAQPWLYPKPPPPKPQHILRELMN